MNLPYFLLQSIELMCENSKNSHNFETSLTHQGPIKLFVNLYALVTNQWSWDTLVEQREDVDMQKPQEKIKVVEHKDDTFEKNIY